MPNRRAILAASVVLPAIVAARGAIAGPRRIFAPGGIAISGADPVAYFTENRAVAGAPDQSLSWHGAVWRFASESNRIAFEMSPRAYAPRFGGYCALAVAEGRLGPSVPEAWTVHQGRLYLHGSPALRDFWRGDMPRLIAEAEARWPALVG